MSACWHHVCDVDVVAVVEWLRSGDQPWPEPSTPTKPQRIFRLPLELLLPIIDTVLTHFPAGHLSHQPMLSRVLPGQAHPLHVDIQRADWVTRIHVPIVTNPGCWMLFEDEEPAYFRVGKAYTFDTTKRHAFGNDGSVPRIHLIFDIIRAE